MMISENNFAEARQQMGEVFPSREALLMFMLRHHAMNPSQVFDVCFITREPILEVGLDHGYASEFLSALTGCFGRRQLHELLDHIVFSDGTIVSLGEIWALNPMPTGGFEPAELATVDLAEADEQIGDAGETVREIINATYRTASTAEEDCFIRRWLAS